MKCPVCTSGATSERPERTELGYRRFRCRDCHRGFNERSGTVFNRLQYPTDVICLVVLWRLRYKLSLRDLVEMFVTGRSGPPFDEGLGLRSCVVKGVVSDVA